MNKGQTVYLSPGVNTSRYNTEIREGVITSLGSKCITVTLDGSLTYKFNKVDFDQITDYAADYYLYFSRQEIEDKQEHDILSNDIRKIIREYGKINLSLDQLRKIKSVIGGEIHCG